MPKSYSQYKYEDIATLGLRLEERVFIEKIPAITPSELLSRILEINTQRFHPTEKSKSEFIIAPILNEIAYKNQDTISFFSGHRLDIDTALGLKGFCDFLFTKSPRLPFIKEPVFCVAEAKKDDPATGVPQCIAEMYAARLFNERQNKNIPRIYGCVTTGYLWQFLKLEKDIVTQDPSIFGLNDLPKILGVLQMLVED